MKKLTADELYKLFQKTCQVKIDNEWYRVYGSNEDEVYLINDDNEYGDEFHWTYDEIEKMIAEENAEFEFYELKKIEL